MSRPRPWSCNAAATISAPAPVRRSISTTIGTSCGSRLWRATSVTALAGVRPRRLPTRVPSANTMPATCSVTSSSPPALPRRSSTTPASGAPPPDRAVSRASRNSAPVWLLKADIRITATAPSRSQRTDGGAWTGPRTGRMTRASATPGRWISTVGRVPTAPRSSATASGSGRPAVVWPSTRVMMSPAWMPARSPGLPGKGRSTVRTPRWIDISRPTEAGGGAISARVATRL